MAAGIADSVDIDINEIKSEIERSVRELIDIAKLEEEDIFVVGCSSSEIAAHMIGCLLYTSKKADVVGKWSVFFFYPADFTFVCPTELEDLQNKYADFKAAGCEVYSVSTDTHFVHKAWADTSDRIKNLEYVMLADPTHALSTDFEVLIPESGLAERGSFIVNPEGKIVAYEVNAGNVGRNADELFRKLQACPVSYTHLLEWETDLNNLQSL